MTRPEQSPWTVGDGEPTDDIAIASPTVGDAERARVDDVLASDDPTAGDQVDVSETAFAAYCDADRITRTVAETLEVTA